MKLLIFFLFSSFLFFFSSYVLAASKKRSHHEYWISGGGGVEEQNHRHLSTSPAGRSIDALSPSASSPSVRKKMVSFFFQFDRFEFQRCFIYKKLKVWLCHVAETDWTQEPTS